MSVVRFRPVALPSRTCARLTVLPRSGRPTRRLHPLRQISISIYALVSCCRRLCEATLSREPLSLACIPNGGMSSLWKDCVSASGLRQFCRPPRSGAIATCSDAEPDLDAAVSAAFYLIPWRFAGRAARARPSLLGANSAAAADLAASGNLLPSSFLQSMERTNT